jgi:hypothetical protein
MRAVSVRQAMRPILATCCVVLTLAACAVDVSDGSCPGEVRVNQGLLAGGSAGEAVAASAFLSPLGARVLLAGSADAGCILETRTGASGSNVKAASIRLTLAPGLEAGTYQLSADAGAPFKVQYAFSSPYYGGFIETPQSGTLTLTRVDPLLGVEGSYHIDFGGAGISGGTTSADGGTVVGTLGELIEDGTFVAPVCSLCGAEATCGGVECPLNQVCSRDCGGSGGQCIPAPNCSGAPSCGDCDIPSDTCCDTFDGVSLICGCFP